MCQLQFQTFRFGWGISKGYPEEKYKWLTMGVEDERPQRKLKLLGLHGFRTSGEILQRQLSKWGPSVHELIDLVTTILTPKTLLSPLFQKILSTHRGYDALQRLAHRECALFRFGSFIRVNCRQLLWSGFQVVKMQTIVAGIQPLYLKLGNRLFPPQLWCTHVATTSMLGQLLLALLALPKCSQTHRVIYDTPWILTHHANLLSYAHVLFHFWF